MRNRRWHLFGGRFVVYVEPRDAWIGAYIAEDDVYVCLLPFLVIKVARDWTMWKRGPAVPEAAPVPDEARCQRAGCGHALWQHQIVRSSNHCWHRAAHVQDGTACTCPEFMGEADVPDVVANA